MVSVEVLEGAGDVIVTAARAGGGQRDHEREREGERHARGP
jgi:hypothetical protein